MCIFLVHLLCPQLAVSETPAVGWTDADLHSLTVTAGLRQSLLIPAPAHPHVPFPVTLGAHPRFCSRPGCLFWVNQLATTRWVCLSGKILQLLSGPGSGKASGLF